ncbi:MAG: magnesium transporter [Nitrospiraceae bacterium]|nr:MAG: magnesium transporter [Nitrospiraceae bacterium]
MTLSELLATYTAHSGNFTWINIDDPDTEHLNALKTLHPFNDLNLEDCLSETQIPKIDEYDDYLFIVLHFPRYVKAKRYSVPIQLSVFLGKNFLVTVHNGELKPLQNLFSTYRKGNHPVAESNGRNQPANGLSSPASLLYSIIYNLSENLFVMSSKILTSIVEIEEAVFDEHVSAVHEVTGLRHNLANFRRIVFPLKRVIHDLEKKVLQFTREDMGIYFSDLTDYIDKVWTTLEECRETLDIYKETDIIISSNRTNKILTVLTILFTFSIPVTVMGTLYGMNVHLPGGVDKPWMFLGPYTTFIVIMTASIMQVLCMFYIFRRLRWL